MNPNPPCEVTHKICIFFCCRWKTDLAHVNAFAPGNWKSFLVLSAQRPFEYEFELNWLACIVSQSASFRSGVAYCMFSSHVEFLHGDHCVFTLWFTLHKLSTVDPLRWLSFDWDKRKTCSVRAMVVQGLISSWHYTYTKSIWTAGCHWNWKENLYDGLMHFFSISVYLVQFFCIGNSFCWRVCWNFPRPD